MERPLLERLDKCLLDHAVATGTKEGGPDIADVYQLQELSEVHYYLKSEHNFTAAEVAALMQFADPLEVAAACWEGRAPENPDLEICYLLNKIEAYETYPLVSEQSREQSREQMIELAKAALYQNYMDYKESLLRLDKPELIEKSSEITAVWGAYEYMRYAYAFRSGDAETLLRMENPLQFVAEVWASDVTEALEDMRSHLEDAIEGFAKFSLPQRGEQSPAQEKPSIREQLHNTVRDTGQRQPPEIRARDSDAR